MEKNFIIYERPNLLIRTIKKEQYILNINKENLSIIKEIELILCKLLEEDKIDLFLDEPKDIGKNIKREKYSIINRVGFYL